MYKTILEKQTLPLHGRLWILARSQIVSNRDNPQLRKRMLDGLATKKCHDFRLSVPSVGQATTGM